MNLVAAIWHSEITERKQGGCKPIDAFGRHKQLRGEGHCSRRIGAH